ncbi:MAG: hypothetical protein JO154_19750 [Chitinophaga sp.]|uniref:terpene synthase family protein n=1 Tax=Chitinophaga sp. TaxID=1869181 RepID=UPI0025C1BF13|nr:hypothetical protein [Chitinophaga sp.]MBV8254844.1 hypothetical protein [Chitinophaga sp.]
MHLYRIPRLYCPYATWADQALTTKIAVHTQAWLRKFELLHNEEQFDFYEKHHFAALIVSSYPNASEKALETWCDLNALLFLVDDHMDETTTFNSPEEMLLLEGKFMEVLHKGTYNGTQKTLCAFNDFWQRAREISTVEWQQTFVQNIRDMFAGSLWQLKHILHAKKPALRDYQLLRQYLGAAHLATDCLTMMGDVNLPEEITSSVLYARLTGHCRNAICYSNDLFSLSKEMSRSTAGAAFNLVSVLSNAWSLSMEAAISEAVRVHNEEVHQFELLSAVLLSRYPAYNKAIRKYLEGLQYLMTGNIHWSTKLTARYPHIYEGN